MAANTNYSYSAGIQDTLPIQGFLQRRALENVEPNLGYMADAQMIEQPKNNGRYVQFFRYTELPPIDKPLFEGITPDGQNLEETAFSVMTKNYGGWMSYTDELDLWHVDKKTIAISDRLNNQAKLTLDTVCRDQICAGLNVMYPGSVSARSSITASDKISYAMIKKAVRNLKMKGAQPFEDGFFHAKIDHETYYDLTEDDNWKDANKYQDKTRESKYELGTLYKVKFFEVDNGKVFKDDTYIYGTTASLPMANVAYDRNTRTMVVTAALDTDTARWLTGKLVQVKVGSSYTLMCIEKVTPGSTTAEIKFRWQPAASVTNTWVYNSTASSNTQIVPTGGGAAGVEVHASLIYGKNAFGCVTLGTAKKPNIQMIVKPLGSEGSTDPLNQRGSIAWKVPFFACAVLQDDFICRLEHAVSA